MLLKVIPIFWKYVTVSWRSMARKQISQYSKILFADEV
jgi:hypothetical protein